MKDKETIKNKTVNNDDLSNVRKSKAGDEAAFGALYRKYREKVYTHIYFMVSDKQDALDLTTDSFIKAYKGISRFREESSFYTWILSISTRVAIDHLRKRKKIVSIDDIGDIPQNHDDYEDNIDRERVKAMIIAAQKLLSPKEQACFTLRFFEEKPVAETADIMNVKKGTVKSLYHRAFNKMKDYISKNYMG